LIRDLLGDRRGTTSARSGRPKQEKQGMVITRKENIREMRKKKDEDLRLSMRILTNNPDESLSFWSVDQCTILRFLCGTGASF
jgi:hypothetical protein